MVYSLQGPFFPKEAEKKGATPTEYGFVFGVFELVDFIFCPIYGNFIRVIGPKFMLNAGNFVMATCCIIFGFLDRSPAGVPFISLAFAVRIVEALGQAGFITASYTIVAYEFPGNVASTFSVLETLFAVGIVVGPTVGGLLYEAGGFLLPFASVGGFLWLTALFTTAILPQIKESPESPPSFWKLFKIPTVLISYYSVTAVAFSFGFLQPLLEPHLRQFDLPTLSVSFIFIVNGATYALTAVGWGYLADKQLNPKLLSGIGAVFIVTGFLLMGPAPFFPVKPALWLVIVSLMLHGIGSGAEYISAFLDCNQTVIRHGFPDNTETYGLVAGLWASGLALGSFLGPSLSGMLSAAVGFRNACMVVVALHIVVAILSFGHLIYEKTRRRSTYEAIAE